MNRDEAFTLLREYTKNENLIKHMLAVEAAMRVYARKYNEDEEKWGIVGLIHDFDYEMHPTAEEHPIKGSKILEERGYPEDVVYAIKSHANHTGVERKSIMDKTLYACDELAGLITAVALVRPTKKLAEVEVKSVKKKMKDKSFAAKISREDIQRGVEDLGVPMEEHIATVLEAMKGIADKLGL
jgi:putative nucleotidyltransferase with HDIG domain